MDIALSLMVLTSAALVAGAIYLWRRFAPGKQVWLMLLLAVILGANVLIWAVPGSDGAAPMSRAAASTP